MLWRKRLAELSQHLWLLAGSAVLVAVLLIEHLSTLAGLAALIAVLLIGDWFRSWWTFNLPRTGVSDATDQDVTAAATPANASTTGRWLAAPSEGR